MYYNYHRNKVCVKALSKVFVDFRQVSSWKKMGYFWKLKRFYVKFVLRQKDRQGRFENEKGAQLLRRREVAKSSRVAFTRGGCSGRRGEPCWAWPSWVWPAGVAYLPHPTPHPWWGSLKSRTKINGQKMFLLFWRWSVKQSPGNLD
jgi:hypothetical protein